MAGALCACTAGQSESFKGTALHGARAPDITLTDDTGSRWTLASQRGTAIALFFGYTHCLDTCPLTLAKLADAVRRQNAPAKFTIAFVTVDPRRDTPAVLHRYVRRFSGAHIVGLTGSGEQIAVVERSYGVWAQSIPGAHGRAGGYDEAHSSVTYLIDPNGRERVLHNDGDSAADFAADLGLLAQ